MSSSRATTRIISRTACARHLVVPAAVVVVVVWLVELLQLPEYLALPQHPHLRERRDTAETTSERFLPFRNFPARRWGTKGTVEESNPPPWRLKVVGVELAAGMPAVEIRHLEKGWKKEMEEEEESKKTKNEAKDDTTATTSTTASGLSR